MLGDHWFYIVILLLIALVVFGPKRLPELGQALGKAINEFRRATQSAGEEAKSLTSTVMMPTPAETMGAAPSPIIQTTSTDGLTEAAPGTSESAG